MTAGQEDIVGETETADGYGRRSRCFVDYTTPPFSFGPSVTSIKATAVRAGENKLLNQLALEDLAPSHPVSLDEKPNFGGDLVQACLSLPLDSSSKTPPLFRGLDIYQKLLVSTEPLALASDPETDLRDYLKSVSNKRFGQPLDTWLPLAPISRQTDGESPSSPRAQRLRCLLQRELENEAPVLSVEASAILEELRRPSHDVTPEMKEYVEPAETLRLGSFTYAEPVTPPILASSEDGGSPFVPLNDSNTIDLTSPPTSPRDAQALPEDLMETEQLPLAPNASVTLLDPSPSQKLPNIQLALPPPVQHLEIDVPVLTSPESSADANPLKKSLLPVCTHGDKSPTPPDEHQGFFDEAFSSIIQGRASYVQNLAEQEVLNSVASVSRMQVPVLDFEIPQPKWTRQSEIAETHFRHLQRDLGQGFGIRPALRDFGSESSLRWNPVPPKHAHVSAKEDLPTPVEAAEAFLEEAAQNVSSATYLAPTKEVAIFKEVEEKEIMSDDATSSAGTDAEAQAPDPAASSIVDMEISCMSQASSAVASATVLAQPWSALLTSVPRELLKIQTNLLPRPSDTGATSALVSSFMQLRGKKPRAPDMCQNPTPQVPLTQNPLVDEIIPEEQPKDPAPTPEFTIPKDASPCVISLALSRTLVSHLETIWPPSKLLDVDFSRHDPLPESSPAASQPSRTPSTLSIDADIALSPSVGIIITNLLKVKQRALPGSKHLAPLRERIQQVSAKYETLFVLVSESHPLGEFTSALSPADVTAYADLVRFAVALPVDLRVLLVPGAEATLAKWIVSLMCAHSSQTVSLGRHISARETAWELFLRQAGFNVISAKVLAGKLLEDAGPTGLARYIVTPVNERIAAFATILGGNKVIRSSSARMDREWR